MLNEEGSPLDHLTNQFHLSTPGSHTVREGEKQCFPLFSGDAYYFPQSLFINAPKSLNIPQTVHFPYNRSAAFIPMYILVSLFSAIWQAMSYDKVWQALFPFGAHTSAHHKYMICLHDIQDSVPGSSKDLRAGKSTFKKSRSATRQIMGTYIVPDSFICSDLNEGHHTSGYSIAKRILKR